MPKSLIAVSGCDSGFGRLLAERLAAQGHRVLAGCLTEEGLEHWRGVPVAIGCRLDVTDAESIESFRSTAENLEGLVGLVNNAGVVSSAPFELETERGFRQVLEVNLFGAVNLTRALLPMLRQSCGRVVNVSSVAGLIAFPTSGSYTVSKHGVEAWSDVLRRELYEHGVSVSLVEPGFFRTNLTSDRTLYGVVHDYGGKEFLAEIGRTQRGITAMFASGRPELVVDCMEDALLSSMPKDRNLSAFGAGVGMEGLRSELGT
eukprot:TRINITY_DN6021_c0_g3_i1.p1 TRINITY_DN6021_c0_g3~~TRINITY_DN6021_c0_g3_i1.p1  ORF type:complete len:260 (+),score=46.54 TRINITY_DN6021_c0_g3_i1:238-1017(+)